MSCEVQASQIGAMHFRIEVNCKLKTENGLLFLPVLGDVNNLVLENEKIRPIIARDAHHILVVILDPATHNFAVREFEADDLLLLAERLQVIGFLESFVGRRRSLLEIRIAGMQRHVHILQRRTLHRSRRLAPEVPEDHTACDVWRGGGVPHFFSI
jgi:hypothetical protein